MILKCKPKNALVRVHYVHPIEFCESVNSGGGEICVRITEPPRHSFSHHALMSRHIAAYAATASEALSLYDQDEADEGDIVPLTVDRFTKHLEGHGETVSPNFLRALTDFALLGTILHITRYTLGV